jgi:hypothetical protein
MNGRTEKNLSQFAWSWGGSSSDGGKEGIKRVPKKSLFLTVKWMKHGAKEGIDGCRGKRGAYEIKRPSFQKVGVCKYDISEDSGWVE